jgi:hypothetical protein
MDLDIGIGDTNRAPAPRRRGPPFKHYASFADFYQRELAETWGRWSDLEETYRKYSTGAISKEQVQQELGKREIGIAGGKAGPGRGNKTACNTSRFSHKTRAGPLPLEGQAETRSMAICT